MNKYFFLLASLFLFACAGTTPQVLAVTPQVAATSTRVVPTNTPYPTPSPLPTIDYQATDMAHEEIMSAQRNDMVKVQLAHDESMLDKQIELARIGATQTFAPTAIALTDANMTLASGGLTLEAKRLEATALEPVRMQQIIQLQDTAKYAKIDRVFRMGFMLVIALFVVVVCVFLIRFQPPVKVETDEVEKADIVNITLRDEKTPAKSYHFVMPCSPEQLTELAEMVMNGERTFAYNRMETNSRTFKGKRDVLVQTRAMLEKAQLATTNTHSGESIVNDRGVAFFEKWFETHQLPDGYEVAEESK